MAPQTQDILSIAGAAGKAYLRTTIELSAAEHVIEGMNLCFRCHEIAKREGHRRKAGILDAMGGDHWSVCYDEAEAALDGEMERKDFALVRFLMGYDESPAGEIIETTATLAKTYQKYGIAVPASEEESEKYWRKQRLRSGGWMDDPAWVRFAGNFKRVLRAERLHRGAA